MPTKRTVKLTKNQKKELESHRDHSPHPHVRERCAAILKIADGTPVYKVAEEGLLKPRTRKAVTRWLNYYEEHGIKGLINHQHGGNRKKKKRIKIGQHI